ncbi:glucan biosynthesis protein [Paracoccus pacificus]|uniref:Glucan biosynthesis protein n=1 Tax=Paracoccus pacificus TaxID=1463598 RepID=A0ABW4R843_9RHOB
MIRRDVLRGGAALAVLGGSAGGLFAQTQTAPTPAPDGAAAPVAAAPFGFESVVGIAKDLSGSSYAAPQMTLRGTFAKLTYDQYRAIRFRRDRDPWGGLPNFAVDLLPPGMIYTQPVEINIVENGQPRPLPFNLDTFEFDPKLFPEGIDTTEVEGLGWSGFRLRAPLNRPDFMDEFVVFQGASYFRAVARGTIYGLSARGLAIGTGSSAGEEFPLFRTFWIHRPQPGDRMVRVNALLDSDSVTGAYEFLMEPGADTVIQVRCALFPRRELQNVGIAPLTSMFWFSPADRPGIDDFRSAVHDSDGLQMLTGEGARLWRLLSNPANLQISAFQDSSPRGFGLAQRARSFDDYRDTEADYQDRPSAWVQPVSDFGRGSVTLVEIPVRNEFNDNIVSYWQPAQALAANQRADFAYDLIISKLPPDNPPLARAMRTMSGISVNAADWRTYNIDFSETQIGALEPQLVVQASAGKIGAVHAVRMPEQDLFRLAFEFTPGNATLAELSARLVGPDGPISETWLHRWTSG